MNRGGNCAASNQLFVPWLAVSLAVKVEKKWRAENVLLVVFRDKACLAPAEKESDFPRGLVVMTRSQFLNAASSIFGIR